MSSAGAIEDAAAALRRGGVVVYPTETLYGLGVDAGDPRALERLLSLKGRDAARGVSVLVETLERAAALIEGEPPAGARALAEAFWPGPLTLVVQAAKTVDAALRGPSGGVGLRCSSDPVCRRLLAAVGRPLTSTSANLSGLPSATTIAEARSIFGDRVDCYLDDGPRSAAIASTVVEFLDGSAYLRRSGAISADRIFAIVPILTEG
ncbi:MAG: L-threonylcarbamoyladenylate synthase [Candidatus Binatia bacterium]